MNNDNNGENNGNKGRFSDRLKKIRRDRLLKRRINNFEEIEDKNSLRGSSRNILKIFLATPSIIYGTIKYEQKNKMNDFVKNEKSIDRRYSSQIFLDDTANKNLVNVSYIDEKKQDEKRIKINKIKEINVPSLSKKCELNIKQYSNTAVDSNIVKFNMYEDNNKDNRLIKLQKEIIDLIKKNLVKNINELELLQSELYLLKELSDDDLYLKDCQEDIKEIKKLLSKVKSLKEKYDYLKDNVDFEYMLEYDDDVLIDKILELKELCSRDDIRNTVNDYKVLNEYKFLYLKIDKLQENIIKYDGYKNQKSLELKKRDIDFDTLKTKVYDVDREKERYEKFVREQELFLKGLEDKISHIDSYEKLSYRMRGFNQLLGNSFKYLGLLLVNPLKGVMPGIVIQTIITKNVIHNLYKNLEWEENKRIVYETIDYSNSINNAIDNLDNASSLVDVTLKELIELKSKYMKDFKCYEYSFSTYRDVIKKINKMENAVLGSKIKIDLMKQKMMEKEKQNNDKMKKVKKLNSSNNN